MTPGDPSHRIILSDFEEAENVVFRLMHRVWFQEEIESLSDPSKNRVSSYSLIVSLNPIMENSVLKVGGSLSKSHFPLSVRHPIILPKKSHVTTLLIRRMHVALSHAGRSHVLPGIHQQFWIIKGNCSQTRDQQLCYMPTFERKDGDSGDG